MKVKDLMSRDVVTLGESDVLVTAEEIMGINRFRHLPVVDDAGLLVGLVTRKDVLSHSLPSANASKVEQLVHKAKVRVADVMRRRVRSVDADHDLAGAAKLMADEKIGCLPITEGGQVVGILTEADFVRMVERLLTHAERSDPAFVEALRAALAR
jgi:CBS domain-containing membrane protein